ncbi:MAG: uroporphyrinogen-III C-methyltransferase [Proteobacteria bacterium]|nr:uroporphyrinogen-III C-methyltransferase [Pseudomonadota bacterium]
MDYLPVFLDLRGQRVLLVGGGAVAARKAALLQAAGATLRIVAPRRCGEIELLCTQPGTEYLAVAFEPAQLAGCVLAIAATDTADVNARVAAAGRAAGVWVNVVDEQSTGSCLMPSIVDRSPVIVAIGTGGASPTLARRLRASIEALLPERMGELARAAGARRGRVRAALPALTARQRFWEEFFDSALAQQILAGASNAADIDAGFDALVDAARAPQAAARGGAVWLIGAGPGDPDLLTLRAQQLLQQCDVVLYDRLVPAVVLARVRRDAERVFVGKEPGRHRTTQQRIHELLIEHTGRGRRVARLKGGDPMVFARGGEELLALAQAGVPVIVVPGVTAALGAASSARIPLTHRGAAQSVCFVTAMGEAAAALDWRALAAPLQTVVFYMGAAQLPQIVARLVEHGAPPERPAAIVEHATLADQRVLAGHLRDIAAQAATATVRSPALLIVGDVAQFAGLAPAVGVKTA